MCVTVLLHERRDGCTGPVGRHEGENCLHGALQVAIAHCLVEAVQFSLQEWAIACFVSSLEIPVLASEGWLLTA